MGNGTQIKFYGPKKIFCLIEKYIICFPLLLFMLQ